MMLGLSLAGCSTDAPAPAAESSSAASATQEVTATETATEGAVTAPVATPAENSKKATSAPAGRKVTLQVKGAKSDGVVKALVITADGKESGGEMKPEKLPFSQELTLPTDSVFTKILVLGKYPSGGTGEISCSISIDGKEVASQTSTSHKPAECLFVEKDSK